MSVEPFPIGTYKEDSMTYENKISYIFLYHISCELSASGRRSLRAWRQGQGLWDPSQVRKLDKTEHREY